MDLPLNAFDLLVIAVVLVSTVIAVARGFLREVLSVAAFIAAALAALRGTDVIVPTVLQWISSVWLAHLIVVMSLFLLVFVGVTLITHSLTSLLHKGDQVGFFDRVLGLFFGAARGVLLVALFMILYNVMTDTPATWIAQARSCPLVATTGQALQSLADTSARVRSKPLTPGDYCGA
jgi:membrane protein required for colicin V production